MPAIPIINRTAEATEARKTFLLEFQGRFELNPGQSQPSEDLAKLGMYNENNRTLTIGNQLLTGHSAPLKRPMAVCRVIEEPDGQRKFAIEHLVTEKILFDSRPSTIMR